MAAETLTPTRNENGPPVQGRFRPQFFIEWGAALAFAGAFAAHVAYYWLINGVCSGSGTGIIGFVPTLYPDALPYVNGRDARRVPAIDPTALQFTWFDDAWYLIVFGAFVLLMVSLFRWHKRGRHGAFDVGAWGLVLFASIATWELEQYTSCDLRNTHLNMRALYEMAAGGATLQLPGQESTVAISEIPIASPYKLVELKGSLSGEPEGAAYIIKFPRPLPSAVGELFPDWLTPEVRLHEPRWEDLQPFFDALQLQRGSVSIGGEWLFNIMPFDRPDGPYASIIATHRS